MTDTLFKKLQAAYRRGVDFACWHFNTSEEKYMELWKFVPRAAYDYADKETGDPQTDDGKDAEIEHLKLEMDGVDNAKEEIGRLLGLTEEFRWKRISAAIHEQKRLIRELVAALKPFAEEEPEHEAISEDNELVAPRWLDATYGQYRAARAALAKAKAAGFEP